MNLFDKLPPASPGVSPSVPRLTSLSHGGGCGCKIAPGVLREILKNSSNMPGLNLPAELLVGIETADNAAVYQLNHEKASIASGRASAKQGCITGTSGSSGHNWSSYGSEVSLPPGFLEVDRALLSDPQTSGGLLVACSPTCASEVLALFDAQGFAKAAVVARVVEGAGLQVY